MAFLASGEAVPPATPPRKITEFKPGKPGQPKEMPHVESLDACFRELRRVLGIKRLGLFEGSD